MAKITNLPPELLQEIVSYLIAVYDQSQGPLRKPWIKRGDRLSFFNARDVSRAFRDATTAVFFKGNIERWSKGGVATIIRRMRLERAYAMARDRMPGSTELQTLLTCDSERCFDLMRDHMYNVKELAQSV